MQSLASSLGAQDNDDEPGINLRDFVPFFLDAMRARKLSQREVGLKAGITKTRIGLILHKAPEKRAPMTFVEFQLILRALGISHGEAIIAIELQEKAEFTGDERFQTSIKMLCDLFHGLPPALIGALADIGGFDGSEIRKGMGADIAVSAYRGGSETGRRRHASQRPAFSSRSALTDRRLLRGDRS